MLFHLRLRVTTHPTASAFITAHNYVVRSKHRCAPGEA